VSPEENKELVRRLVEEVWNEHRADKLPDYVAEDLLTETEEHVRELLTAFPDVRIRVDDLIAEGDRVMARLLISGTNTGTFAGRSPTGKKVTYGSFRIYRVADGKIVETWAMQDRLSLMEQLGLVTTAGGVSWAAGGDSSTRR
jgi:predicted ester cyclase